MTIKICDRCNSKINTNPTGNMQLPIFRVRKLAGIPSSWVDVDLCSECYKELEEWLNGQKV